MFPLGHIGFALLVVAPSALVLDGRRDALFTGLALSVALVPDLDLSLPLTHHHGGTHTVLFAVVASLVVGTAVLAAALEYEWLTAYLGRGPTPKTSPLGAGLLAGAATFLGLASHLIADAVAVPTAGNPLQPFWPVSDAVVSYPLIPPGSTAWNVGLLLAGLLANLALHADLRGTAKRVARAFGG